MPSQHSSVGWAFVYGARGLPFDSHQCLHKYVEEISLAADIAPEVNLQEHETYTPLPSANKAEPNLALKHRGDITRSPKQGYMWPHKKGLMSSKNYKKNKKQIQFLDC